MAASKLNESNASFISNQPLRVIRRISRDFLTRGRTALQTIQKWRSVRQGEERNIFPFINNADAVFNSALDYELAVLKGFVYPLLSTVPPDVSEYAIARDLMGILDNFQGFNPTSVPETSLIREFIGGSAFEE